MMQNRSLEEIASFVRDLGSECTCLVLHNNMLISGCAARSAGNTMRSATAAT